MVIVMTLPTNLELMYPQEIFAKINNSLHFCMIYDYNVLLSCHILTLNILTVSNCLFLYIDKSEYKGDSGQMLMSHYGTTG